jgi:predicted permease
VAPIAGRVFSQGDFVPGGPAVTILTHGYWQRRFGNDRSVVGRTIRIDSRPFVVAGIMPAGFRFIGQDADLVLPIVIDRAKLRLPGFGFHCVARLRPGVTMRRAAADLARLVPIWRDSWPGIDPHLYDSWHIAPVVRPLKQELTGSVGNILWIVMGTIGIVMLIVCANVANLQLVRAEGRSQELAVRSALGAGSGRLIRELLTESLLLALAGGALGIGLAFEGLRILVAIGPGQLPRLNEISLDWTALAYALAISITTGLVFGSMPAFRYARACLTLNLRSGGRNLSHGRERQRTRNILAIAQVAMALVLLISAGLAIRTFQALHRVQPGFTGAEQLQLVRTSIPQALVPERERVIRMWNDVLNRLRAIPGVSAAAFSSEMPMEGIPVDWDVILAEGQTMTAELPPLRVFELISPDLPRTMGMRLIAGRDYTWADVYGLRSDVIVSENLAREFWGTPSAALGKRLSTGLSSSSLREVIGVFEDVRDNGVQKPAPAIVYWPAYSVDFYSRDGKPRVERTVTFAIRTARAGSQGLLRQIEQAVWSVNPSLPLADVRTMRDVYDRSLARPSFTLVMLAIASGIALMLGLIGIYGVISYAVTQRRREIGIRLALGARDREMRGMFVRYGLRIAAIGCVIGLVAAAAVTRAMRSLLFGISPLDPLIYAGVPLVLTIAVLAASYFPARRAASVDPVETLRAE